MFVYAYIQNKLGKPSGVLDETPPPHPPCCLLCYYFMSPPLKPHCNEFDFFHEFWLDFDDSLNFKKLFSRVAI